MKACDADEERESESDAGSERESVHEQGNENKYDLCTDSVPGYAISHY